MKNSMAICIRIAISFVISAQATLALAEYDPRFSSDEIIAFRNQQIALAGASQKINSPDGIEFTKAIMLNGLNQVINVRGNNKDNPAILFLHGGPGWPMLPIAYKYLRSWEEHFTVVQWDQRGAGKTQCANPAYDPATATFEDFLADAEAVVKYLRSRLNKKKIIVLGHSWGSLLGIHLIKKRPEWVSAYIGTGQIAYNWQQEKDGYEFALQEAYARDDKTGVEVLQALRPYPDVVDYMDKMAVQREHIVKYGGGVLHETSIMSYHYSAFFESPDYTLADWACTFDGFENYYHRALEERQYKRDSDIGNLPSLGYDFEVPIFFFLGTHDEIISARLGAEYFTRIVAPYKRLVLFRDSAHMPPMEEPQAFTEALRDYVLPVVAQFAAETAASHAQ